jgi:hypothetical protein
MNDPDTLTQWLGILQIAVGLFAAFAVYKLMYGYFQMRVEREMKEADRRWRRELATEYETASAERKAAIDGLLDLYPPDRQWTVPDPRGTPQLDSRWSPENYLILFILCGAGTAAILIFGPISS